MEMPPIPSLQEKKYHISHRVLEKEAAQGKMSQKKAPRKACLHRCISLLSSVGPASPSAPTG